MAQRQQRRKVHNSVSLFSKEGLSILGKFEEIRHTGRYQAGLKEEMPQTKCECLLKVRLCCLPFNAIVMSLIIRVP